MSHFKSTPIYPTNQLLDQILCKLFFWMEWLIPLFYKDRNKESIVKPGAMDGSEVSSLTIKPVFEEKDKQCAQNEVEVSIQLWRVDEPIYN